MTAQNQARSDEEDGRPTQPSLWEGNKADSQEHTPQPAPAAQDATKAFDGDSLPPVEPPRTGGFDLESIALADDYADGMGDEDGQLAAIAVRKPSRDWFIRAHPTMYKNVRLLEIKDGPDRGFYIVHRSLWTYCQQADMPLRPIRLTLATSRGSGLFLWPLRLQEKGYDNRKDYWCTSALRICKMAETTWVRVFAKEGGTATRTRLLRASIPNPPGRGCPSRS